MKKTIHMISDGFDKAAKAIAIVLLAVISVVMFVQVIARYVFNNSISWSEELSRYCFIWFNCLGTTVLTKTHTHARISMIDSLFKKTSAKRIYWLVIYIIAVAVSVLLIVAGLIIVKSVSIQHTPALGISKAIVYAAAPAAGVGMLIHSVCHIVDFKEREEF